MIINQEIEIDNDSRICNQRMGRTGSMDRNEQVEQDLLICRALTEIYKDPYLASHLAFRGGTALHKLFLSPQPRYSEDIDLVQVKAEPIKETYDRIREALSFLGEPKVKQKKHNNTLIFRLESEIIPVVPIHPRWKSIARNISMCYQCRKIHFSFKQMV